MFNEEDSCRGEISIKVQSKPHFLMGVLLYRPEACKFTKKEDLAQVFSCEFYEISKNTFFYRTPPVAAPFKRSLGRVNHRDSYNA